MIKNKTVLPKGKHYVKEGKYEEKGVNSVMFNNDPTLNRVIQTIKILWSWNIMNQMFCPSIYIEFIINIFIRIIT